jgi:amino acid adenylation domain-containing protein
MDVSRIEGFRLSPQQERLWALSRGSREAPYRAVCEISIDGPLEPETLETSLRQVAARHEIFRTALRQLPGLEAPLQIIQPEPTVALHRYDLCDQNAEEQERVIESLLAELRQAPLKVDQGVWAEVALAALGDSRWVLLLCLSAFCADAGTLRNLVQELAAGCSGDMSRAGIGEVTQYVDISEWHNELLETQAEVAQSYWQSLQILPSLAVRLPFEHEPDGLESFAAWTLRLSPDLVDSIDTLASRHGSSVATLLLSSWCVLLGRMTSEAAFVVGAACNGRTFTEMEGAMGLFARYLPLQCRLDEQDTLGSLVARIDASMVELHEWQDHFRWQNLGDLEEASQFFPYGFDFDELPASRSVAGLTWSVTQWSLCFDRFRLRLACLRKGKALELTFHFDASVLTYEWVERMAEWLHVLLQEIVHRPQSPIGEHDFLSASERYLLADLNRTEIFYGPMRTLVRGFQDQAGQRPDRIAIVFQDQSLTYAELSSRTYQLARYLRRLGLQPEAKVALCVERSLEMVVGILGILAAGGAYVPMDPDYPLDRRSFLLEDAGASLLLTVAPLADHFNGLVQQIVYLDRDWPEIAQEDPSLLPDGTAPENLAYVIYTSGSTGRPKGVMVSHGAILNRLLWMQRVFPLDARDAVLQKTPYSFDASIWEIFVPLLAGARLVLAEPGGHRDGASLLAATADHEITVLQLVPSFLPVFLEQEGLSSSGRSLRRLFCGGEALSTEAVERLLELLPAIEPCNLYGPTEASIDATFHPCGQKLSKGPVPIGRPLDNVTVFLLDRRLRLLPPGLSGELCIGGAGLARGYRGRPDLTAERFIPHPWGKAGERLYRTGDLVRLTPGGALEFQGRIDGQVKIRGFRIEPGEIEAVLRRSSAVREAVVAARERAPGDVYLAAYIVSRPGQEADPGELREMLRATLPDFMIPAAFVKLDTLPRLPNGKLDRRALPEPSRLSSAPEVGFVMPRTPMEDLLATIWAELLHRDRMGIHEDFFAAGGHSLLATQLVSRIREIFRVELKLRAVFEAPTIAGLAEHILTAQRSGLALETPPLRPVPRRGEDLPLSFAQQRLWFLDQLDPGSAAYNLLNSVRLEGELNVPALVKSFGEMVRRHESLRTTFTAMGGEPVQRISEPEGFALPLIDLSGLGEAARAEALRLAREDARRPFDLERGPLFRPQLMRLGPEEHGMLATMHHIIGDRWSTSLCIRELRALYEAFSSGMPSPLPELPVQYADFATWQRQYLTGERLKSQLSHWRERLSGAPAVLSLPLDRPRPAMRRFRGASVSFRLPEETQVELARLRHSNAATLFMVLLAAFEVLLSRWSGQEDLVVGSPVAGRSRLEVENLIGFFVNTLALRGDVSGDPSFIELLSRVRQETLTAYAYEELPFEKLVEELQPERSLAHSPLFQVMLALENVPPSKLELLGLSLTSLGLAAENNKFDLTVILTETASGLACSWGYDSDLFDAATMRRCQGYFQELLRAAATEPSRCLSELSWLSEVESQQLLREWNGVPTDCVVTGSLHEQLASIAQRWPDATAMSWEGGSLSYGELNRRSGRLARRLRALGVGPEVPVALCLDRSPELIVAVLGILKSGGAYLPMDPSYPRERHAWILADSRAPVVVTSRELLAEMPVSPAQWLILEDEDLAIGEELEPVSTGAENLAYVIYTSGSTGRPKGVLVRHGNAMRLFAATQAWLGFDRQDVWTLFHSHAFDFSVWEMWGALLHGGRLVIVPYWVSRSPSSFHHLLRQQSVTILSQTPSAFGQLVTADRESEPAESLRLVIFGGEALDISSLLPWWERYGEARPRLVNMYGITETTVHVTYRPVFPADLEKPGSPIGTAISDLTLRVLDRWQQPVPCGVAGELYVGGAGLAQGYLNRPELTAERFVPDPFSEEAGARLYRSGDLVRYRTNGDLEHLGRIDFQVKIRGFRIELGEIESLLRAHPAVREAVVLASRAPSGDLRLVGYVVPVGGSESTDFRAFLREKLPEYMIPAVFLTLDALPLTQNGKLDRKALPDPDMSRIRREVEIVLPETPTQEMLAEIWAEVLGLERIGIRDNFFDIGGNSLAATRVTFRLSKSLGFHLPVRALFAHPTIDSLARRIEEVIVEQSSGERLDEILDLLEAMDLKEAETHGTE